MGERPVRRGRPAIVEETNEQGEKVRVQGRLANEPKEPTDEEIIAEREADLFDYEKDLAIDANYLDAEFLGHAELFMKYAKEASVAKRNAARAEETVKTTRSMIIRNLKASGEKLTESAIEAMYRTDVEYIRVKEEKVEADYYADLMTNAVFAFQSRKTALENLVKLYISEYNSGPSEPRDLSEAARNLVAMKEGGTEKKIRERMKR